MNESDKRCRKAYLQGLPAFVRACYRLCRASLVGLVISGLYGLAGGELFPSRSVQTERFWLATLSALSGVISFVVGVVGERRHLQSTLGVSASTPCQVVRAVLIVIVAFTAFWYVAGIWHPTHWPT